MTAKTLTLGVSKKGDEKFNAGIKECFTEMEKARKRMRSGQAEIEKLKAQTRQMLAALRVA